MSKIDNDFIEMLKAAEAGDAETQYRLGSYYYNGEVITEDGATGIVYYCNGEEVTKDAAKAAEWLLKAAEQGHAGAQTKLGDCYRYGEGVAQDKQKAAEWYQKAADKEYAQAEFELGHCYDTGSCVPQNYAKAAEWYTKAVKHGHRGAQDFLDELKRKGMNK
jgi:TPR repeat protein